jgi:hypothetical protein
LAKKKIILEYDSKNVYALDRYQQFFQNYLVAGNKIPARVLIKFLSHFTLPEKEMEKIREEQFKNVAIATINRFKSDKEYYFTYTNQKTKSVVSFENMITTATSLINDSYSKFSEATPNEKKKGELAYKIYASFCSYRNYHLNIKHQRNLTDYKLYVIVCFIMNNIGYRLAKQTANNYQLFQGIRYTLDKFPKEKRLIKSQLTSFEDAFGIPSTTTINAKSTK